MSLLSILADLSSLAASIDRLTVELTRIADASERLSPPLAEPEPLPDRSPEAPEFSFAESPEEYQARIDGDATLAAILGVVPGSPAFQLAKEMRANLTGIRIDANGETSEEISFEEADRIVQDAFREARSEANRR